MKKITNNIFKFFLNLIPNKKLRAKLKAKWTINYIKQYAIFAHNSYIPHSNLEYNDSPPVFQYWEQGIEFAPNIIKACVKSIDKFEPDRKHIILDFKTIENYIEIPSFIYDKKREGKISYAQFSDILRSAILAKYPAIWADSSILLTGEIPKYVTNTDFFMYKGLIKTPENFKGANYFCFSKTPNRLLIELYNSIIEYWMQNDFLISYFTHPHFISILAELNTDIWDKIPPYDELLTLQFSKILFNKFDENIYKTIIKTCPIHKLTYKPPKKSIYRGNDTYLNKIEEMFHA